MKNIKNRLKRIEGQIRGLQTILDKDSDCEEIVIQFSAVKSALDNCYALLLSKKLSKYFEGRDEKDLEKVLKLMIKK